MIACNVIDIIRKFKRRRLGAESEQGMLCTLEYKPRGGTVVTKRVKVFLKQETIKNVTNSFHALGIVCKH